MDRRKLLVPQGPPRTSYSTRSSGIFSSTGSLWMGSNTYEVPLELFALNRRRLIDTLYKSMGGRPLVLLQGGTEVPFYNTDTYYHVFRQEPFFMWTFGVIEPGCYGAIDISTSSTYLFIPRTTDAYQIILKGNPTVEEFTSKYNIRNVNYCDEMPVVLHNVHPSVVLTLDGVNSDSGLHITTKFEGSEKFKVDHSVLYNHIADLRVFKTDLEISVMKYVATISSEGHRKVMRFVKGGNKFEYQCEAEFLHYIYSVGGCRNVAYTCICASGDTASTLNYGNAATPNDKFILPHDFCLFDMGAKYFGYSSAITCSFPASGKFTADQKIIYQAVLTTSVTVIEACKPGVSFVDLHILGLKTLMGELVRAGLLHGDPNAMVTVGLAYIFQPHGLGYLIGLDVFDVGGYLPGTPPRRGEPRGIEKLKTARVLDERMVLAIHPGCYFIDVLLDEAFSDPVLEKFLVKDALERFRGFGGVRIGDVVLITKRGSEILSEVPRTVKDIEKWMAGKNDKKFSLKISSRSNSFQ